MNAAWVALQIMVAFLWVAAAASLAALVKGCFVLRRLARRGAWNETAVLLKSPLVPAVSVLAVARDLSPESRDFVRRVLALDYNSHEVVLVLDGLPAAARDSWVREFPLAPGETRGVYRSSGPVRLTVLDREPGGEADALNAALEAASGPLIALIGPDCEFDPAILLRLVRPMLEDPGVAAVCSAGPQPLTSGLADRFGALESARILLARAAAWAGWNRLVPVPGSALLIARDAVVRAGGFTSGPLELMLHLHGLARQAGSPLRVALVADRVTHVRAPHSWAALRERNARDQRQIAGLVARRKSVARGVRALGRGVPALFAVRFLRPLVETAAWLLAAAGLAAGWIDPALAGVVLLSTVGVGLALSLAAAALAELAAPGGPDSARLSALFLAAIPENFGYRQVRNLRLIAAFLAPQK